MIPVRVDLSYTSFAHSRFAFSDWRPVRTVESGEVEIWVASHASVSPRAPEREHDERGDLQHRPRGCRSRGSHRRDTLDVAVGAPLRLAVKVRDQDHVLTVATGGAAETTVSTADGRELDSVATGGILGLWLGIYGTSAGAATTTVIQVDSVHYQPLASVSGVTSGSSEPWLTPYTRDRQPEWWNWQTRRI